MIFSINKKLLCKITALMTITYSSFVCADIPYVNGVDYLPQHYNGYYDGKNRNGDISDDDIERDFSIMSQNFDAVRTYEYDFINLQRILRAASRYEMKVAVGVGVNPDDPDYTNAQLDGIRQMFEQYPELLKPVIAFVVGNGVIQNGKNYDYLMQQFYKVSNLAFIQKKSGLFSWFKKNIDVTVSETDTVFKSAIGQDLLKQLPKNAPIFVNINPYMSGFSVNEVISGAESACPQDSFCGRWKSFLSTEGLSTHQIVVGESGWPTEGEGAISPIQTQNGNLQDAIDYYTFLYPFLKKQTINKKTIAVPLFSFLAFDQPMNGIFGFSSNFWGVYNADGSPKYGMIYPLDRSVKPTPKLGTNLKITLINAQYGDAKMPVLFKTKGNVYSNKPIKTQNSQQKTYSFLDADSYPYVEYSLNGSNIVSIILPETNNPNNPPATCTNELLGGNGYGTQSDMSLKWASSFSKIEDKKNEGCKYVNWAENGIVIIGENPKE